VILQVLAVLAGTWSLVEMAGHDPGAYTQGFELHDGILYESTGTYGRSSLRRTDPSTGEILQIRRLPDSLFAEGLTFVSPGRMLVLTWREGLVLAVNPATLETVDTFTIRGEGWGICFDGESVIRSDGTDILRFHDPGNMRVTDSVRVTLAGIPQHNINELEFARGIVWANQWQSSRILAIDPSSGEVVGIYDLSALDPGSGSGLNGIAYDGDRDLFIVTGKNWPVTYTIDIDR
jgi:glutaminyl-peptide cyclotransferase